MSEADVAGPREDKTQGVQVLSRAADILRLLKDNRGGLTQAEMASKLGLARTTVHRLLNALVEESLVQGVAASSRYRLGPEILRMAEAARGAVLAEIHPCLEELSREIGETVDLSLLDRRQATFIDQVIAPNRLQAVSVVGASFPLHCTANGKAMLAAMSEAEARRLLDGGMAAMTRNTVTSADKLLAEIAETGARGVAFDMEEHSLGICAAGLAIRNTPLGLAALSVPVPAQRFEAKRAVVVKGLKRIVRQIESLLSP